MSIRCAIFGCKSPAVWQRVLVLRGQGDARTRVVEAYYCDACKVFWDDRPEQQHALEWPWVGTGWRSLVVASDAPATLVF